MNALIAIAFAVALSTQMLLKNAQHEAARIHELVGTAVGQQLDRLTQAVNSYSSKNLSVITSGAGQIVDANGNAVVVVNKYAPTVAELNAMGFLTGNFNAVNYFGGGYVVALNNSPVGCAYPNCMLDGMVYLTAPVLSKGLPDITVLGAAVQKIGGNGGFSKLASPGTISGFSGGWNKPNPAGNVAGILAEQAGTYSYDSLYYRLDGSKGLTATFNAGNQALSNIKQVSSGSVCVGNTFALSDGTNGVTVNMPLTCVGGAYTPPTSGGKMPAANFAALPTTGNSDGDIRGTLDLHRAYMWYASLSSWVPLTVDQNGNFSVPGTLTAQSVAASGRVSANTLRPTLVAVADTSCAGYQQGDLAQNAAGLTLSCQSGSWKALGGGGLGVGQTLQDVTASRALGAASACAFGYTGTNVYTNNTGKPIFVSISMAAGGNSGGVIYVDGIERGRFYASAVNAHGQLTAVVPSGSTYSAQPSCYGGTLVQWSELR